MALYEFECQKCTHKFEQITSEKDPENGKCPKCGTLGAKRLISRFWVAGQGDLRESTFYHGCHDHDAGHEDSHDHDHHHDHPDHDHGTAESDSKKTGTDES